MNRASVKPNAISRSTRKVFPEKRHSSQPLATSIGMGIEVTAIAPERPGKDDSSLSFVLFPRWVPKTCGHDLIDKVFAD